MIPVHVSVVPTLIIKPQLGSPAAGTCQDERQGLEMEREKNIGHTILASRVSLPGRLCTCVCCCGCDLRPTLLSGQAPGTTGQYPDLLV